MPKTGGVNTHTGALEQQIAKLTRQIRQQNQFAHRFAMGIVVGAGTALGATIVAAFILLLLRPIFTAIGLETILPEQIQQQRINE